MQGYFVGTKFPLTVTSPVLQFAEPCIFLLFLKFFQSGTQGEGEAHLNAEEFHLCR